MTILVSSPERGHSSSTILTRYQHVSLGRRTTFSGYVRFLWWQRLFAIWIGGSTPSVHRHSPSGRGLVHAVVVSWAPVTPLSTPCAVTVAPTWARSFGAMTASFAMGVCLMLGCYRWWLLLCRLGLDRFRAALYTIPLCGPGNIPCLQIQTTGIANHRPGR